MPTRIDQSDGGFDSYITSTTDYLEAETPTNGERLGLTVGELTEWSSRRDAWVLIYAKHKDASKRTKTITAEKDLQKKAFIQFANPLLTRMSVSPALTSDDRGALHLSERDAPTERTKIETTPLAKIIPMEGGDVKIRVRTTEDGNRASKHPDADHVEMRYALVSVGQDTGSFPIPDPTIPRPPSDTAAGAQKVPTTAAECPYSKISKKAIFIASLGQEHSGKRIYAFFRWVNASKEENSSSWSTVVQSVVV
ncbi:MAG: hypothetical protein K9J17_00995 [Flavobacteriales bacterium]|nr:hypothetical protein [Flavobacteriales bacterium]